MNLNHFSLECKKINWKKKILGSVLICFLTSGLQANIITLMILNNTPHNQTLNVTSNDTLLIGNGCCTLYINSVTLNCCGTTLMYPCNSDSLITISDGFNYYYSITNTSFIGIIQYNNELIKSIAPNPFSTITTLKTSKVLNDATLTIYNSFGQYIRQINHINGHAVVLQREDLPPGLYFAQLSDGGLVFTTGKLIIIDK